MGLNCDFLNSESAKKIKIRGIIHVGCHKFDELYYYKNNGIEDLLIFEANPHLYEAVRKIGEENPRVKAFTCAVCDRLGTTKFHITNNEQSSSILKLKDHEIYYPEVTCQETVEVECTTIDHVIHSNGIDPKAYNVLTMDIQGAELLCLRGASEYLNSCDMVFTEVNYAELYEGCGQIAELEAELAKYRFVRRYTMDYYIKNKWGDALYTKE